MPFDGSGTFDRVMNWVNDAVANIKIRADRHDAEDDNFASGLTNCITKDGQTSPTADIPMNGHKLINVGNATNPQDALTLADLTGKAVRYDAAQALTLPQQLQAHANLADTATVKAIGGAYNLLQSDRRKLLLAGSASTITLPAAAVVGNDFSVDLRAFVGLLTIHPPAGVQIDGVATVDVLLKEGTAATLWCDGTNWFLSRINPGTIVRTLVNATVVYTRPDGLQFLEVEGIGTGAGGGNALATGAAQSSVGGGGGAGGHGKKLFKFSDLSATQTLTIGAAGIAGGNGGVISFGSSVLTIAGATAGTDGAAATNSTAQGGTGGIPSGAWDVSGPGAPGLGGLGNAVGSITLRGTGGSSPFGGGGVGAVTASSTTGNGANGFGAGGSGASNGASQGVKSGGGGSGGFFLLTEYF